MSKAILKFEVHEAGDGSSEFKIIEIVTDRTPEWTMSQYLLSTICRIRRKK